MPTDIEIARAAKLQSIAAVAERAGADRRIPGKVTYPVPAGGAPRRSIESTIQPLLRASRGGISWRRE